MDWVRSFGPQYHPHLQINIGQSLPLSPPSHKPTVDEHLPPFLAGLVSSSHMYMYPASQGRTGCDAGQKTLSLDSTLSRLPAHAPRDMPYPGRLCIMTPRASVLASSLSCLPVCHDHGLHGYVAQRVRGRLSNNDGLAKWAVWPIVLCCQLDAQTF